MKRRRPREHIRHYKSGKKVLINKGIKRRKKRYRKLKFSDNKTRHIPQIDPMRPKDYKGEDISNWIAEEKKDGSLTMQYIVPGAVAYVNRRFRNKTPIYPELTDDESKYDVKGLTITQGEAYVLKGNKDSFEDFLKRDLLKDKKKAYKRKKKYPLRYEAFDILMKDGKWVTELPLSKRKSLLSKLLKKKTNEVLVSNYSNDPIKFTKKKKRDKSVEGVVYKNPKSQYLSGRSKEWQKKKFRKEADVVIFGYKKGEGKRAKIGALKAGVWDKKNKKIKEVAWIGSGIKDKELQNFKRRLDKGQKIFGKVKYLNMGSQGRLRVPIWKGERKDITIKQTHI
jgi:bifunctional non-homologous end joining protein LigD